MSLPTLRAAAARRANTLLVVLALMMLVAAELGIVHVVSSGNARHAAKSNGHLRAIHIAESGFSTILARLKGAPWSQRWFALGPAAEYDRPLLGGTFSAHVSTVAGTGRAADVWVESRFDTAVVVMFWRVRVGEPGLDFHAQVYPEFFSFLPPDGPRPSRAANPVAGIVTEMIDRQRTNERGAVDLVEKLEDITDFEGVARTLGIPRSGPVLDETPPLAGARRPQSEYVDAARPDPPPDLPPPPAILAGPGAEPGDREAGDVDDGPDRERNKPKKPKKPRPPWSQDGGNSGPGGPR